MLKSRHQIEDRLSPPKSSQAKKVCIGKICCGSGSSHCMCISAVSNCVEVRAKKSVTFDDERLAEIFEFEDDAESKSGRKLFWEIMAADRLRFRDRIKRLEGILSPILSENHRKVVYVHRVMDSTASPSSSPSSPCPMSVPIANFGVVMVSSPE